MYGQQPGIQPGMGQQPGMMQPGMMGQPGMGQPMMMQQPIFKQKDKESIIL